jgi:hypothetical protein
MYSSYHSETVEELLEWPWKRFEKFYESFTKRRIIESLESRKDQMISALWANSNYDDDKGTREKAINEIESNFNSVIASVFEGKINQQEEEIDESNPFFASAKKGQEKLFEQVGITSDENSTVKEVIDYHK